MHERSGCGRRAIPYNRCFMPHFKPVAERWRALVPTAAVAAVVLAVLGCNRKPPEPVVVRLLSPPESAYRAHLTRTIHAFQTSATRIDGKPIMLATPEFSDMGRYKQLVAESSFLNGVQIVVVQSLGDVPEGLRPDLGQPIQLWTGTADACLAAIPSATQGQERSAALAVIEFLNRSK